MKRTTFSKMRAVSDGDLQRALINHKAVLEAIARYCGRHKRLRWVRWAWMAAITGAVCWLLWRSLSI